MSRGNPPVISRYTEHLKKCKTKCEKKSEKYAKKAELYGKKLTEEEARVEKK